MEIHSLFTSSSETQGQSVGSGEEVWQKFSGFFSPDPKDFPWVSKNLFTPVQHKNRFQFLTYSLEISDPFDNKGCQGAERSHQVTTSRPRPPLVSHHPSGGLDLREGHSNHPILTNCRTMPTGSGKQFEDQPPTTWWLPLPNVTKSR